VFAPPYFKARLIGIFLAVLELVRNHGIGLESGEAEGDIWLVEVVIPEEEKPQDARGEDTIQTEEK
jgi:segregation and condensation protein A